MVKNFVNKAFFGLLLTGACSVSLGYANDDFPEIIPTGKVVSATICGSLSSDELKRSHHNQWSKEYDQLAGVWGVNASLKADVQSLYQGHIFSTPFEPVKDGSVQTSYQANGYQKEIDEYCTYAKGFGSPDFLLTLQRYGTLQSDGTIKSEALPGKEKVLSGHPAIPYPEDQVQANVGKKVGYYANPYTSERSKKNWYVPHSWSNADQFARQYLITWGVYLTEQ